MQIFPNMPKIILVWHLGEQAGGAEPHVRSLSIMGGLRGGQSHCPQAQMMFVGAPPTCFLEKAIFALQALVLSLESEDSLFLPQLF